MFGFRGAPRPGGDVQSIVHTIWDGKKTVYTPTGNNTNIFVSPEQPWGALEGMKSGEILGVVSTETSQSSLTLNVQSDAAQTIGIRKWDTLHPDHSSVISGYLMLADGVDQVEKLKSLPASIE